MTFFLVLATHTDGMAEASTLLKGADALAVLPPEPLSAAATDGYLYVIRPGDTLWDIAAAHGMPMDTLIAANLDADPRRLRPGNTLFVPGPRAVAPRPASRAPQPSSVVGPRPAPAAGVTTTLPSSIAAWPAQILAAMNEQRAAVGRPPLAWSDALAAVAQAHAMDSQRRGWGSHIGSDGATLRQRLARAGYPIRWVGENWANARNPEHAFVMWWDEPPGADPHRSNILNPMYTEAGIGITAAPWGYYFFVDFGNR